MNLQIIALVSSYFLLMLIVLPSLCTNKVFSVFYDKTNETNKKIELEKNEYRKMQASLYLEDLTEAVSYLYHDDKLRIQLDHLFVIVAKKPSYQEDLVLTQLATEIDLNIRETGHLQAGFFICNATRERFPELSKLAKYYLVIDAQNTTSWSLFNEEEIIRHDFLECLTLGINAVQAKYITIIRDSVLIYHNFLATLDAVIARQLEKEIHFGDLYPSTSQWLFLHLHEPLTWRYCNWSFTCIQELTVTVLIGMLVFYLFGNWTDRSNRFCHCSYNSLSTVLFGGWLFFTLFFVIGRPYILELRRLAYSLYKIYEPSEPILFSAMTLPFESAATLNQHIRQLRCTIYSPFHEALYHVSASLQLRSFTVSPSLVRYVAR